MVVRVDVFRHAFTANESFQRKNPALEIYSDMRLVGDAAPDPYIYESIHSWTADFEPTSVQNVDQLILTRRVDVKGYDMEEHRVFACYLDVEVWNGNEYIATIVKPKTKRHKDLENDIAEVDGEQLPVHGGSPYRIVQDKIVVRDKSFTLQIGRSKGRPVTFKKNPVPLAPTKDGSMYNHQIDDVVGQKDEDTWRVVDWAKPSEEEPYKYLVEAQEGDGVVQQRWYTYNELAWNGEWIDGKWAVVGSYVTLTDIPYPNTNLQGAHGVVSEAPKYGGDLSVVLYPWSPGDSEKARGQALKVRRTHMRVLDLVGSDGTMETPSAVVIAPPPGVDFPVLVNSVEPEEEKVVKPPNPLDRDPATLRFKEGDAVIMDLRQDFGDATLPEELGPFAKRTWWGTVGPHDPEAGTIPVAIYDEDLEEQTIVAVPKLYLDHEDWLPELFEFYKWEKPPPPVKPLVTGSSAKGKAPLIPRPPRAPPSKSSSSSSVKRPRPLSSLKFRPGEAVRLDFREDYGLEFPKALESFKGETMYGTVVPHTHSATAPNLRVCIALSLDRPDYDILCAEVPKIYIYHMKKLPANFEPLDDTFFDDFDEEEQRERTPSPEPPPKPSKKRKPRTPPPRRSPSKRRGPKPASPPPSPPPPPQTKPVSDSAFRALLRRHKLEVPGTEAYDKARTRATTEIAGNKKACGGRSVPVPTYTYPSATCRKENRFRNRRYGPACKTFTKCVSKSTAKKHQDAG